LMMVVSARRFRFHPGQSYYWGALRITTIINTR
jgi:hypothetical protein